VIRVLLGSRASSLQTSLEAAIRSIPSLEFAGAVHSDRSLTDLADVLLIEVNDWLLLGDLPIPVILLADPADSAQVNSALRAGVRGAIPRDATPQEIESAVHAVYAGLIVITPTLLAAALPDEHFSAEELAEPLSGRELEVLDLLAEGLSNKLIAHRLNISEHTVKTHVGSIFAKLGASSRTEAVSRAIRRGLVML
jgi:DNA-binding NarL/FixJ family response regulator